ncbi:MAG: NADP-specific glutamate dehydrogenase [Oscillospiraceae bacterium]|nr:NADP-specific glutamate dehydrogenase [Oscillospiraceae bacterium]
MSSQNAQEYIQSIVEKIKIKDYDEPEFLQAVEEVLSSLEPVLKRHPEFIDVNLLERFCEPERQMLFKVSWIDDAGKYRVNRGYRIQFNGNIGPYKGGLRFHPNVNQSIMKFLGFEQTLKNSLTGLSIGGGKGGADFNPKGKSDREINRFCESFMLELYKHIGKDVDVPAGDMGVGEREIGYLFGMYRRIKGSFDNGALTGKGLSYGGSLLRPEATGYGVAYFADDILNYCKDSLEGKTVAVSGFGQVAWGVCKKMEQLGAKVVTLSGPEGYIYDKDGVIGEKVDYLVELSKEHRVGRILSYADKYKVPFYPSRKPWEVKVDIAIPSAIENDILIEDAKNIVNNGVKYVVEAANMPCSYEALAYLTSNGVLVGPAKAANAGGVAVSALEMSQNSIRLSWTAEEVDSKLKQIMKDIFLNSLNAAQSYGLGVNLIAGANIAGFEKISNAMMAQGYY